MCSALPTVAITGGPLTPVAGRETVAKVFPFSEPPQIALSLPSQKTYWVPFAVAADAGQNWIPSESFAAGPHTPFVDVRFQMPSSAPAQNVLVELPTVIADALVGKARLGTGVGAGGGGGS